MLPKSLCLTVYTATVLPHTEISKPAPGLRCPHSLLRYSGQDRKEAYLHNIASF